MTAGGVPPKHPSVVRHDTRIPRRLDSALGCLGPDKENSCTRILEDVGDLFRGQVEVHRNGGRAPDQPAHMRNRSLDGVLRKNRNPVVGMEYKFE